MSQPIQDCVMIAEACLLLELSADCRHCAQATYHTLCPSAGTKLESFALPATCTFVATKSEEKNRSLKHIVAIFNKLRRNNGASDSQKAITEDVILRTEVTVLQLIGFRLYDSRRHNPFRLLVQIVKLLEESAERRPALLQVGWRYLNDSYLSRLCVTVDPLRLAVAVVYLASRDCELAYPLTPKPWWSYFGIDTESVQEIASSILKINAGT